MFTRREIKRHQLLLWLMPFSKCDVLFLFPWINCLLQGSRVIPWRDWINLVMLWQSRAFNTGYGAWIDRRLGTWGGCDAWWLMVTVWCTQDGWRRSEEQMHILCSLSDHVGHTLLWSSTFFPCWPSFASKACSPKRTLLYSIFHSAPF